MDTCDGCGFTYNEDEAGAAASAIRIGTSELRDLVHALDGPTARTRPDADTWSPQEYACHVRDVLEVQRYRIAQCLAEDRPVYAPMDRTGRVKQEKYENQDPMEVAAALPASMGAALAATAQDAFVIPK